MQCIILIDEYSKVKIRCSIKCLSIGKYLDKTSCTFPVILSWGSFLWQRSERRVVLPAPDAPIIASISPGLTNPVQLEINFLSFTSAQRLSQLKVIDALYDI